MALDFTKDKCIVRIANRHERYSDVVRKYFDVYFNAVEPQEEDGFLVADFSKPAWHRYRHNGMWFFLSALPEECEVIREYFRHANGSRLAFDIGAYCGLSTYEMSRRYEHVIAFEPDPNNLNCLVKNLIRHKIENVTVVPCAIMGQSGSTSFLTEGSSGSSAWLAGRVPGPVMQVSAMTLADACILYGVPDFISMDIELTEIEALVAARKLLAREKISFVVDTAHGVPVSAGPVEQMFRDAGYQVETELLAGFETTWAWK